MTEVINKTTTRCTVVFWNYFVLSDGRTTVSLSLNISVQHIGETKFNTYRKINCASI